MIVIVAPTLQRFSGPNEITYSNSSAQRQVHSGGSSSASVIHLAVAVGSWGQF